jgi:hypothetical protein
VVETGKFVTPIAYEYASIVSALGEAGYQALSLEPQDNEARALVTRAAPVLEELTLERVSGAWQIHP